MRKTTISCFIVFLCISAVVCTGCATIGNRTDGLVLEHQKQLAEYQATVNYYLGRVDSCAERIADIGKRAETLTGEIDRVIALFEEYQLAVEQLLRNYNSLRNAVEAKDSTAYKIDSDILNNDIAETGRLLSLLEGN